LPILALVAVPALLSSCTSPHAEAVSAAARSLVAELEQGDGAGACGMLTPKARTSTTGATDETCAHAITSLREHGTTISHVTVWGDAAQVRIGGDVLFLRRINGSWLISGAGCRPQPSGPYDCEAGG
jgi:hypothetical protein